MTVRAEEEPQATQAQADDLAHDPLFGMWRDREDMADMAGYLLGVKGRTRARAS